MPRVPTVTELDLLTFFEVEPKMADRDIPWPYNQLSYTASHAGCAISFKIAPSYFDVHLELARDGAVFYALSATQVSDIIYHRDNDRETLEFVLDNSDRIWLRLRPQVSITQEWRAGET